MFLPGIGTIRARPSGPGRARDFRRVIRASQRAFTLVELLAAVVGAVVVLGAATGFMLTALLRQKTVVEAQRLEEMHDSLAHTIGNAVKTADAFQIYPTRTQRPAGWLGGGSRSGNFLVCLKTEPDGSQSESDFELAGDRIIYAETVSGTVQTTRQYPNARIPRGAVEIFTMNLGIIQAGWEVATDQDLLTFHVCAMPLIMR